MGKIAIKYSTLLLWLVAGHAIGQTRQAIVYFRDKAKSSFSVAQPTHFLTQKALDRRLKYNIEVNVTDIPVNTEYLNSIAEEGVKVKQTSRWLNAALVEGDSLEIARLITSPFLSIAPYYVAQCLDNQLGPILNTCSYKVTSVTNNGANQLVDVYAMHQIDAMQRDGLFGEGVSIAVLDAGFNGTDHHNAFSSLWAEGRIKDSFDFFTKKGDVFTNLSAHGTQCLTTLAANDTVSGVVGLASKADYYLYRTENDARELVDECFYWVAACERADSLGVDIISSSLGYNSFDRFGAGFDTSHLSQFPPSFISRAANMATAKGIIVVISAGNEGENFTWGGHITFPSDADSCLAVGAVIPTGQRAPFSSMGRSGLNKIKPDVVSKGVGCVIPIGFNSYTAGSGTSFAAPTIAGFAAALLQQYSNIPTNEFYSLIRQSGSNASKPNLEIGYGPPSYLKFKSLAKSYIANKSKPTLYPNPISGNQIFVTPKAITHIFDVTGKQMLFEFISVNNYSAPIRSGLYFVYYDDGSIDKLVVK